MKLLLFGIVCQLVTLAPLNRLSHGVPLCVVYAHGIEVGVVAASEWVRTTWCKWAGRSLLARGFESRRTYRTRVLPSAAR